ncbi:neuronal acetylcholine receptor subunit alpha-6-like [Mytilus californianus]|uniref:neuronal acetylcholine receptor subunit alpha-6-like n=1 Tax=Mytilus californianus TaxID=6549 RepID=UPI00224574CC|nr:neuronal acetylcholine receptor subunit alpha-6-like [Mytilus californianus]
MEIPYFINFILLGVVQTTVLHPKQNYSIELEERLRTEMFTNYTVQQRPSQKVRVAIKFNLLTVNDLNIKDQTLSLSGYLTLDWKDTRLVWNKSSKTSQDYSNIKFLFATEEYVWRPSIIIENGVDGISVISDKSVPMRIAQDGRVIWNPAGVYKVSCESDTKYYPMDTQECYLKISAWAYTKAEIELFFKAQNVDTSFYTVNGEWNLLSAESFKSEANTRDGDAFSSVSFLIRLQRRLLFHVVNTLFPVALMAILIAFVFKLPVDSGEKIGFSLTVLLSYAVYLTLISDNIPSTSVTVCLLSMYLAFILLLATIAVCLTTFVINLHMRTDDERIPDWVKKFTSTYLIKFACWKQNWACKRNKVNHNGSDLNVTRTDDIPLTDKANHSDIETENEEESRNLTWKELSEIMDKVFYNIYMILIVISTLALFLIIIIGYNTADS